jgi:hypothetical protein
MIQLKVMSEVTIILIPAKKEIEIKNTGAQPRYYDEEGHVLRDQEELERNFTQTY